MVLVEHVSDTNIGRDGRILSPNFSEVGPVDGLVGYWTMNGNSFDYNGDVSIRANHGTVSGATVVEGLAPRDRKCYKFLTATDNQMNLTNTYVLGSNTPWSVSFWGYKSSYGTDGIMGFNGTSFLGALTFISATQLQLYTGGGSNPTIEVSEFPTNTWFHFVLTHTDDFGANVVTVYRDGVSVGTAAFNPTGVFVVSRIGDNPDNLGTSFNGHMFDFRIYNKVLTLPEIKILSKMFDTESGTEMKVGENDWYTFGQFKEQL